MLLILGFFMLVFMLCAHIPVITMLLILGFLMLVVMLDFTLIVVMTDRRREDGSDKVRAG